MELYDMIRNISGKNNEEELIKSISSVREQLNNLDEERMCRVYSGFLLQELLKRHIPSRLIRTSDLGLDYEHEFVLVAKSETDGGYFLADLTFSQFKSQSDYFNKLLKDGYQSIDSNDLINYLNIVSKEYIEDVFSPDDIFFSPVSSNTNKSSLGK